MAEKETKAIELLIKILQQQTEALNQVCQEVISSNKFRDEKSAVWQEVKDVQKALSDICLLIKGDGLDKEGIYSQTKINKAKVNGMEEILIPINSKVKEIDGIKNKTDELESKVKEIEDYILQIKILQNSLKILWKSFITLGTANILYIIKFVLDFLNK